MIVIANFVSFINKMLSLFMKMNSKCTVGILLKKGAANIVTTSTSKNQNLGRFKSQNH